MLKKWLKGVCTAILLLALVLAAQVCTAKADLLEPDWPDNLPGRWSNLWDGEETGEDPDEVVRGELELGEDGRMIFSCFGWSDKYLYSCAGTWSLEETAEGYWLMTLEFTSTDNPRYEGREYRAECLYDVYEEAWAEDSSLVTALIFTALSDAESSPFIDAFGWDGCALYRVLEPNMRVVKCKSFVSLRVGPSTSAERLAKVPLGAQVLGIPEYGEINGFIWCAYGSEYGYILAEYLEPIE